ncbi:MAG: sigma-54 dependent transcriptional regulator [bacterium]|nr:sigma-54 dependent transcriptional regulator [bacterium]
MALFLVAEDDRDFRELLVGVFQDSGHEVDEASDGSQALERIRSRKYDLVLTDVKLPGKDGMEVLRETRFMSPDTEVVMMTAYGSIDTAATGMKLGASDFLQKPFSIPELEMRIEKVLRHRDLVREVAYLRHTQEVIYRIEDIVGESAVIRKVLERVRKLANSSRPLLIQGETGTGRQLIAGAIHFNSGRSECGFVRVSCAVRNQVYLESDLFGHVRGAFPGADKARIGRIEQANGGTIFIEEFTEAPVEIQGKLLDLIKRGTFVRYGGNRDIIVDVRVVMSTSRDLDSEMRAGRILLELVDVLKKEVIDVPPLRDRREDIPLLANYFLHRLRQDLDNGRDAELNDKAVKKLISYDWPGNIRELKNVLERALFISEGDAIEPFDVQLPDEQPPAGTVGLTDRNLKELEKEAVIEALEKTDYIQKDAAKLLGISKRVIHYKIQQFGIKHPRWIKNK